MKNHLMHLVRPLFALAAVFRRLAVRRDGNVMVLFAMASIPVIIAAGIAIDSARAYMIKQRLGSALDAAALAVGSQSTTATSTQLTTALNNYFYDNYCKKVPTGSSVTSCTGTVATEYNLSVQATTSITAATVNFTASATVPTTFMRLVGINSLPVTATAQTTKFPGMEIAVVLDNTGSMLCGPNDNAPAYSDTACAVGVVTGDTSCTNSTNQSRICTLINAAKQFVTTLQAAVTAPQSIYMSIVPYVTTVNVGNALCSSSTSCTRITTDAPSGDFADLRGNIMPVIPITGTTTSGSTSVSSASFYSGQTPGYVSGTAALQAGMTVYGHGIASGTTISSASGTSITLSSNAALTYTGNSLAVGPPILGTNLSNPYTDPTTFNTTGTWTSGHNTMTVASTSGIVAGMVITGTGIPTSTSTTVSSISGTTVTMSANATANGTSAAVTFSLAGSATSGSTTISSLKGTTASLNSIVVGMGISGTGIPANAYVTSTTGSPPSSITISAALTSTKTGDIITLTNLGATTTSGSTTLTNVSQLAEASSSTTFVTPQVGDVIVGNGIPANTTVVSTGGTFSTNTGTITLSQAATTPSNFSSATGTCCDTALVDVTPISYTSLATTPTTPNWGGCVIEPTSSDEMSATGTTGSLISSILRSRCQRAEFDRAMVSLLLDLE
jgi:Flp pilus assembly protein TadG